MKIIKYIYNLFLSIFYFLGQLSGLIFKERVKSLLYGFRNTIYSGWASNQFAKCSNKVYIMPPLNLIGGKNIFIGENFVASSRLRIEALNTYYDQRFTPTITIGNNVSFQFDCHVACINRIEIGNNVLIASRVFICDHFHGDIDGASLKIPPAKRKIISKGAVIIKDNVWLGEGVIIMPGVTIGENCIIGANSVVTKSISPNCIAAGVPARVISEYK